MSNADDRDIDAAEASLRSKLTPEWFAVLAEAVAVCGWQVDLVETQKFLEWCRRVARGEESEQ